jgi:superfamily II DNA helicase RecQ
LKSSQGKSLCYQLPAVVLGGTTIVISPLIALMVDQVKALNDKGVTAALISSGNGEKTNKEIFEQLLGRSLSNSKLKSQQTNREPELKHITLLYVTPEQVQTSRFRDAMVELHKKKQLTLFAIDEAHW